MKTIKEKFTFIAVIDSSNRLASETIDGVLGWSRLRVMERTDKAGCCRCLDIIGSSILKRCSWATVDSCGSNMAGARNM